MPGTQPDQGINLENPNRCLNCHGGFNPAGEPGSQWTGSMMSQAARDPLWWASITVAAQDSIWALGNPNATDICLRCHMPEGWLGGRSDPTNATLMTGSDFDGVHCDVCHRMWDPFFEDGFAGDRESSDWTGYWDEAGNTGPGSGTLSQTEAERTLAEDRSLAPNIRRYVGDNFFAADGRPFSDGYTENASGQYFVSPDAHKRASFVDADARHQMLYSRYHKSKFFCGSCHDISNPVFANLGLSDLVDQTGGTALITEQYSASQYFHVERTFSEFMLSAYGRNEGGAPTNPEFRAQGAPEIAQAAKCQDCHMRDIRGTAANKMGTIFRPDDSTEHPNSGVPLHDMTGGNAWISHILASLDPNGPVYDPVNVAILDKGPAELTLDLNAGQSPKVTGAALKAGSDRAKQQLLLAATIKDGPGGVRDTVSYDPTSGALSFVIQNNAGHKLITGFPEGRRMWVNVRAYAGGSLIYEVNPYDDSVGTLKGLETGSSPELGPNEAYVDALVYEMHPSSSLTGEAHSFHFVLGDGRSKDNRIPPKGFDKDAATDRHSQPVNPVTHLGDPNYFTEAEYAGGFDAQSLTIAAGADFVEVTLYYQGTSREYIEFLRDEINGTGNRTLASPTLSGEPQAYVVQTDPFFAQLRAWGDTIWDMWRHNHGFTLDDGTLGADPAVAGIVPFAMAQASSGSPPPPVCDSPEAPRNLAATGGKRMVSLTWDANSPAPGGYRVYYDQAGKLQHLDDTLMPAFTDTGLRPDNQFCYAVSAWTDCEGGTAGEYDGDGVDQESPFSDVACAIPTRK